MSSNHLPTIVGWLTSFLRHDEILSSRSGMAAYAGTVLIEVFSVQPLWPSVSQVRKFLFL